MTEFQCLRSVPYFGFCLVLDILKFFEVHVQMMQLFSNHIAAGSTSSFYKAKTRGPTRRGGATTLEVELVWLDRIKKGKGIEVLYRSLNWFARDGQFLKKYNKKKESVLIDMTY